MKETAGPARSRPGYLLASLGVVLLAVAAACGVYQLPVLKPVYRSTGIIQIRQSREPLLYATPLNEPIPDMEQFLTSQIPIITGQREIRFAMEMKKDVLRSLDRRDLDDKQRLKSWDDKIWVEVAPIWGSLSAEEQELKFQRELAVSRPPHSQLILVSFRDRNPMLAATAVKLVIAAYVELYGREDFRFSQLMQALEAKRNSAKASRDGVVQSLRVMLGDLDSEEFLKRILDRRESAFLDADTAVENGQSQVKQMAMKELQEGRKFLASGQTKTAEAVFHNLAKVWPDLFPGNDELAGLQKEIELKRATTAVASPPATWVELTAELAASADPAIGELLKKRADARRRMDLAADNAAVDPALVRDARVELEALQKEIDARVAIIRQQLATAPPSAPALPPGNLTLLDANDRLHAMREVRSRLMEEIKALRHRLEEIHAVSARLEVNQQELDAIEGQIHRMVFEGVPGSRVEVISSGDMPLRPEGDRRIVASVGTGSGVLFAGLSVIAITASAKRRGRDRKEVAE